MRLRRANLVILLVYFCLFCINSIAQTTPFRLLLVCDAESTIPALSHAEVRKLFLGVPIEKNGVRLKPLRNASDPQLTEVFLQKIIFMSKPKYEHQLISRVFRLGGVRPKVYQNISKLVDELHQSPESLTYMSSNQLSQVEGVRSVGVLWEDSEK